MGAGEVTDMKQTRTRALFATFFKIGAFTFGGGYAMVARLPSLVSITFLPNNRGCVLICASLAQSLLNSVR